MHKIKIIDFYHLELVDRLWTDRLNIWSGMNKLECDSLHHNWHLDRKFQYMDRYIYFSYMLCL